LARQIPWPRIFAEGIAIVVSILLAFGIQAWWEGVQGRNDEAEILIGLRNEFREIEQSLALYQEFYDFSGRDIETLLALEGQAPRPIPLALADSAFWSLIFPPTFEPGQATLDGLITSGRLERLESQPLRDALNLWRTRRDEVLDNQLYGQDFVRSVITPYLAEAGVPMSRMYPANRAAALLGAQVPPFPASLLDEAAAMAAYDQVRATQQFRSLAAVRLNNIRLSAREVADALDLTRHILSLLEA